MGRVGLGQYGGPGRCSTLSQTEVHVGGRQEPEATVPVFGVVPREEPVAVAAPVEGEEPSEPEVIGKGKKEDEEGPAEEEKK